MRVVEVFGPTIQGEGPYAGLACHFVRFGGCDFRCSWCDTPHAVLPELVRQAPDLTERKLVKRLDALEPAPMLVLSGGNPALQRLDKLLDVLRPRYSVIAVETQGTAYRNWLARVDSLVVSPKPPSSGEATERNWEQFVAFMAQAPYDPMVLKIVVFDGLDLGWAKQIHQWFPAVPMYLSVGTDQTPEDPLPHVAERYRWLCEQVVADPALHGCRVLPQLHVIAWGHRVGV